MRRPVLEGDLVPHATLPPAARGSGWNPTRRLVPLLSLFVLTACDLAPDFTLPDMLGGVFFKEDFSEEPTTIEPITDGKWKRFDDTAQIQETAWWRMFDSLELNRLMDQAMKDNPTLEAARQRVLSARAAADNRESDLYPSIGVGVGPERQRQSPASQEASMPGSTIAAKPYTLYRAQGTISYELDLFGRNRNLAAAAGHDAEAEANNYRAARLSLQTELAQTYFRLLALREEETLLNRTLATRTQSLKLVQQKHAVGGADALALAAAEVEVATVKGDATTVAQSRAAAEHALAILIGQAPSALAIDKDAGLNTTLPVIPAGMPSHLLERRPDIHAAAEQIAAANARIGVARTGYFPEISLSAMGGFVSGELSDLFKWSNRTWMIGPLAGTVLTQPIFEGGKIAAAKAQSNADYGAAVATYKASVLTAFREVEDQLSALRHLGEQSKAVSEGLAASRRAFKVARQRYDVGYSSQLDYLDAERNNLSAERANIQVLGNRYITTVQLIKALGGSWDAPAAPEPTGDLVE